MTLAAADALADEGNALFQRGEFATAATRFERATQVFPTHALAWKGLGHALLSLGRTEHAARAFDRAIGLRGDSATALWGGALAHAELGHRPVAQNYLRRVLALQPTWIEMARSVPALAPYLTLASRVGELISRQFGTSSSKRYRHADGPDRTIDVARIADCPTVGTSTHVSIGFADWAWIDADRPRFEIIMASTGEAAVAGQIVANAAFHLMTAARYPAPGLALPGAVRALELGTVSQRLPHIYFTMPKLWTLALPLDAGPPTITLTQVVPIGDGELAMLERLGVTAFEQRLIAARVDVADLERAPLAS